MKKIIVSSFMGSGSSAITDLLSEYENIDCKNGSYEYVFLHCPNGLFDLEDKLLVGNNMIRSDEALRTFEKTMHELYKQKRWWFADYKNKVSIYFWDIVSEFINNITEIEYNGFWYEHEKINLISAYTNYLIGIYNHLFKSKIMYKKLYDNKIRVTFISSNKFYCESQKFIKRFFNLLTTNEDNYLLLDQLVLPYNLFRVNNYFDNDTKIIVVHRDPRDVFLLNKYVWSPKGVGIPFPTDVHKFCVFYENMMKSIKDYSSNSNIIDINFEDLIYKYDETVSKIENFCQLNHKAHKRKMNIFEPNKSKNNTNINFNSQNISFEKSIIESKLSCYLYNFENTNISTDFESMF